MCTRTGTEVLLISTRSDREHFTKPHTWASSRSVEDFFQLSYDEGPEEFAGRLESYKLSGIEGTLCVLYSRGVILTVPTGAGNTANQQLVKWKAMCVRIIAEKLRESAVPLYLRKTTYRAIR